METDGIMKSNNCTVIINGGNPINDCPTDWDAAKAWQENANSDKEENSQPTWSWDCGFKLDFDGPVVSIGSRFYPPKTHYGPTWDGTVTIYVFGKQIHEQKFDCNTLEELKSAVEKYVNDFKEEVLGFLKK